MKNKKSTGGGGFFNTLVISLVIMTLVLSGCWKLKAVLNEGSQGDTPGADGGGGFSKVSYDADAGGSDLAAGYPTRGFSDSDQVDVWIPFNIKFPPPKEIQKATVQIYLKPIGQLTGTDALGLNGSDGKAYWFPINFQNLQTEFQNVSIEIKEPMVLEAIKTGRLQGVVQDDSAVKSIKLEMTVRP